MNMTFLYRFYTNTVTDWSIRVWSILAVLLLSLFTVMSHLSTVNKVYLSIYLSIYLWRLLAPHINNSWWTKSEPLLLAYNVLELTGCNENGEAIRRVTTSHRLFDTDTRRPVNFLYHSDIKHALNVIIIVIIIPMAFVILLNSTLTFRRCVVVGNQIKSNLIRFISGNMAHKN